MGIAATAIGAGIGATIGSLICPINGTIIGSTIGSIIFGFGVPYLFKKQLILKLCGSPEQIYARSLDVLNLREGCTFAQLKRKYKWLVNSHIDEDEEGNLIPNAPEIGKIIVAKNIVETYKQERGDLR